MRRRDTGPMPAARNSSVAPSVPTMSMKLSIASRCNPRAAAPSAGTSRIQLSINAERASPEEIHASIA